MLRGRFGRAENILWKLTGSFRYEAAEVSGIIVMCKIVRGRQQNENR